jgi:hypothetical protein
MSLQQVHLRINDAATGQPTPVRLRITGAAGTYYAPYGRLTEFATGVNQDVGGNVQIGAKKWAYIDGTCEILLPPEQLHIEITKGPEYKPIDETITLLAGKMSLRFTIERWSDVRKQGWYSGDTRVHFLSPDAALLEGMAEDVAVVNLLAKVTSITDQFGNAKPAIPNILAFSGQTFARHTAECGVAVNSQNVHRDVGSLGLLHCHRVIFPLTFDSADWTLDDWCGQCHRKKGLVIWTDPQHQTANFVYGEPLADLILGNVDAFELTFFEDSPFDALADYYKILDAGMAVPLVGASGKDCNALTVGSMRTYAFIHADEPFSYDSWIEAIRSGRTFVSNGPLLDFRIDGAVPRFQHTVPNGDVRLDVRVQAASLTQFDQLELLWNGSVIAAAVPTITDVCRASIEFEHSRQESGWLAARCWGLALLPGKPAAQRVFAHSTAVMFAKDATPARAKAETVHRLLAELDNLYCYAESNRNGRLCHIVDEARTVLAKKLPSS